MNSDGTNQYALQCGTSAPTTSLDITGLTPNVTYYFVVRAFNAGGEGSSSNQVSCTPGLTHPDNVKAVGIDSQVILSWDTLEGATGYNVKRAVQVGGPYTIISAPAQNSYVDTDVINGSIYYYVVSATNSNCESPDSEQVSATPLTGAAIPTPTPSPTPCPTPSVSFGFTNIAEGDVLSTDPPPGPFAWRYSSFMVSVVVDPSNPAYIDIDGQTQCCASIPGTYPIYIDRFSNGAHTMTLTDDTGRTDEKHVTFDNGFAEVNFDPIIDPASASGAPTVAHITAKAMRPNKTWTVVIYRSYHHQDDTGDHVYFGATRYVGSGTGTTIDVTWDGENGPIDDPNTNDPESNFVYGVGFSYGSDNDPSNKTDNQDIALERNTKSSGGIDVRQRTISVQKMGDSVEIVPEKHYGRRWTATIRDHQGNVVRTLSTQSAQSTMIWDGKDESNGAVNDGTYNVTLSSPGPKTTTTTEQGYVKLAGVICKGTPSDSLIVIDDAAVASGLNDAIEYAGYIRRCIRSKVGTVFSGESYPIIVTGPLKQPAINLVNNTLKKPLKLVYVLAHGGCPLDTPEGLRRGLYFFLNNQSWQSLEKPRLKSKAILVRDLVSPLNYGGLGKTSAPIIKPPMLVWMDHCDSAGTMPGGSPTTEPPLNLSGSTPYSTKRDNDTWARLFGITNSNTYSCVFLGTSGLCPMYNNTSWDKWERDVWDRLLNKSMGFKIAFDTAQYGNVAFSDPSLPAPVSPIGTMRWWGNPKMHF